VSKKVAFIAHCLLNQNAKVEGGAKRPGMWEPVIDLLRERDYVIRQMPCPELAFGGARRFWGVREQFDTQLYREHCRRLAKLVAAVMQQHTTAGDDVVLIEDDSTLVRGYGIFIEELKSELEARGLPLPRSTGIRHWFADYDPDEELRRLEAVLT
jgi:predicted secreted protein